MAALVNELTQKVINGKATLQNLKGALDSMLDQQVAAKGTYRALLAKQASATLTAEETVQLPAAEAAEKGFDSRISAQRKLVAEAEKDVTRLEEDLAAEQARLATEDKALAEKPSGRITIVTPDGERFRTLGEQLVAIQRASRPGATPDRRLLAASGLTEGIPSEGGFLVQQEFANIIWERTYNVGELISRAFRIPLTAPNSNGIKIPAVDESSRADGSRYGGVQVYWTDEGALKTASKPTFRQMDLKLKKVAGVVYTSDELLEDSGALQAFIERVLPIELRFAVENSFVNGSGTGQPLGYMNSGAVIAVPRTTPGAVVYADVLKMWSRMWAPSRASAIWLVSQNVEPQLYTMSLTVGTGGTAVYLPAGGASVTPYSTLFGRPVIPSEYTASLGTAGDIQLIDMAEYVYIEKGGIKSDSSIHVRFLYDETTFRFVYRVDGQPAWNSPITPKNGGDTLSPFVILAT
jgi:HK97 family phage major capsid protein